MNDKQTIDLRSEIDILASSIQNKSIGKHEATMRLVKIFTSMFGNERIELLNFVIKNIMDIPATENGQATYRDKIIARIKEMNILRE